LLPSGSKGEDAGLDGNEQITGSIGKLAENSLPADDNNLGRARDTCCGADEMLKLRTLHGGNAV